MTHVSRRRNRTRLNCVQLEARTQPGSLLTSGVDMGAVAEVVARPEFSTPRVIKRLDNDSTDIQIVGSPADNHIVQTEIVAAPKGDETQNKTSDLRFENHIPPMANGNPVLQTENLAVPKAAETQNKTSGLGLENRTPAKAPSNPVVNRPQDASKSVQAVNLKQHLQSRNLEMKSAPLQVAATHRPTMAFPGGQVSAQKIDNITIRTVDCTDTVSGNDSDGRILDGTVSQFTYSDNGGASSRVFGNAGGRGGANLGTQYLAGTTDGDGLVMRVPSAGACTAVAFDGGADPVQFNDVHATASGLVAVGTLDTAAGDVGLLVRMDPTTLAVTGGPWGYSGTGLDVRLNSTGVRLSPTNQEVVMSGELHDQSDATSYVFAAKWNPAMTSEVAQTAWTYLDIDTDTVPVDCVGNAADADRLANTYYAIACDEGDVSGGLTNVTARLNSDFSTLLWGVTLWDGGGFTATPGAGNLGARLLGGASPSSGLRTVGAFDSTTFNPGVLSSLNAKWTDLSNPAGPTFTGAIWYFVGIDFYGTDVAIQRPVGAAPAQEYTADTFGLDGDHGAFVDEYDDGFAHYVTGYGFDAIGTDEIAYGVDTFSGAGNSDIYFAGNNDGDLGTGLNCDTTYNGGTEGFAAKMSQTAAETIFWELPHKNNVQIVDNAEKNGASTVTNNGPDKVEVVVGNKVVKTLSAGDPPYTVSWTKGQKVFIQLYAGNNGHSATGTYTPP